VVGCEKQQGVIHPNGIRLRVGSVSVARIDPNQNIIASVTLYCEGVRTVTTTIMIAPPA
jgi:hypothetical protein